MLDRSKRFGLAIVGSLALATLTLYAFYARALPVMGTVTGTARGNTTATRTATTPTTTTTTALATSTSTNAIHLATRLDRGAVLRGSDGQVHVEVTLAADDEDGEHARMPSDVLVVLDVSGSMSGQKLDYAKQALHELVGRLGPNDRFGLVTYASEGELTLPMQSASAEASARFRRVIDALEIRGGTNIGAGLDLALAQLEDPRARSRSVRVLLLSDGQANQGDTTTAGLARRARSVVQAEHVLSAMGVGDDFNEDLMTSLADAGAGNFYYLSKVETLPRYFDAELKASSETVARALELRFAPEAGVELVDAAGYPIERDGGLVRVRPGNLFAGQKRTLWITLRAPVDAVGTHPLGHFSLAWKNGDRPEMLEAPALPELACVQDAARFEHAIDKDRWQDYLLNEELHKAEADVGKAILTGDAKDVDRAAANYAQNRTLAEKLGAARVLSSFAGLEKKAESAKAAQRAEPEQRRYSAKQAKSRALFDLRLDAYSDDPIDGL